LTGYSSE